MISFSSANPGYYQDAGAPAVSYQSIGLPIYKSQFYLDTNNSDLYLCTDDSNQAALVWIKIPRLNQLATVATTGSYNDLSNQPSLYTPPTVVYSSPNFASITAATQLSTTQDAYVNYVFPTSLTSLIANQSLTATLQYADNSGMSTNLITVNTDITGCSGLLNLTLTGRLQVSGRIPANKYRRVVLAQSGGATVPTTISSSQEVLV